MEIKAKYDQQSDYGAAQHIRANDASRLRLPYSVQYLTMVAATGQPDGHTDIRPVKPADNDQNSGYWPANCHLSHAPASHMLLR